MVVPIETDVALSAGAVEIQDGDFVSTSALKSLLSYSNLSWHVANTRQTNIRKKNLTFSITNIPF
jgi:hypothetical protein